MASKNGKRTLRDYVVGITLFAVYLSVPPLVAQVIQPPVQGWLIVGVLAVASLSAGLADARWFRPTASFPFIVAALFFVAMRLYFDDRALLYLVLFVLLAGLGEWLYMKKES